MTLSYWNQQFQFTKVLPDFQACLTRMTDRSQAVPLTFQTLSYGTHPRQFIETAGQAEPGSILPVFIHGGYWRALTANMHRFVLPSLAGARGAVSNLEYRLLPEVSLAHIIDDACNGLRLIAEQSGCRLLVIGHSAGAHLAVTAAAQLPDVVAGVVGISGIYDLTPLQWSFLREEVGLTPQDLQGHSPQETWDATCQTRVTTVVGADETPEFHRQAQMFGSTNGARLLTVDGAHHMTVLDALAAPATPLARAVQDLIETTRSSRNSDNS